MFTFIRNLIAANKKTLKNNKGVTMIEYALVLAAVALLVSTFMGVNGAFGSAISAKLTSIVSGL
jgi:Flp pilus assembly pilin Flp